jgi:hypothetical protein
MVHVDLRVKKGEDYVMMLDGIECPDEDVVDKRHVNRERCSLVFCEVTVIRGKRVFSSGIWDVIIGIKSRRAVETSDRHLNSNSWRDCLSQEALPG